MFSSSKCIETTKTHFEFVHLFRSKVCLNENCGAVMIIGCALISNAIMDVKCRCLDRLSQLDQLRAIIFHCSLNLESTHYFSFSICWHFHTACTSTYFFLFSVIFLVLLLLRLQSKD